MKTSFLRAFSCALIASSIASIFSSQAQAGVYELGASGSYRRSYYDTQTLDEAQSISGSVSYYFNEASAIEVSYTDGSSKRVILLSPTLTHKTSLYYRSMGLDLVYTAGSRESSFRPYVKIGANYILEKKIVDQYLDTTGNSEPTTIQDKPALVPSAGIGFKLGLTETLSLKIGIDAWTSRPVAETPVTIDYAGRAGLSWMF